MDTLILFARAPQLGQAKTRLAPVLGAVSAHRLYEALFTDSVALAEAVPARHLLSLAGPAGGLGLPPGWEIVAQPEASFGERMAWSFATAFASGARRCVLIGADAPHLAPRLLTDAFAALRRSDVVLGPTHDGGYYLMGLLGPAPWIFEGLSWGTSSVFDETAALVRRRGLKATILPPEFDVDTVEEAEELHQLLRGDAARAPATARALEEVFQTLRVEPPETGHEARRV